MIKTNNGGTASQNKQILNSTPDPQGPNLTTLGHYESKAINLEYSVPIPLNSYATQSQKKEKKVKRHLKLTSKQSRFPFSTTTRDSIEKQD